MPMERERHEEIINTLNNNELETTERNNLLSELRGDYTTVLEDHTNHTKTISDLTRDNENLVLANSKFFRELGYEDDSKAKKKEEELKGRSLTQMIKEAK